MQNICIAGMMLLEVHSDNDELLYIIHLANFWYTKTVSTIAATSKTIELAAIISTDAVN